MSSNPIQNELPAHAATSSEGDASANPGNGGARRKYEQRHSLRSKLRAYFAAHPGAELGRQEIAEKFFRSVKSVDCTLTRMRDDGELEPVHGWRVPVRRGDE